MSTVEQVPARAVATATPTPRKASDDHARRAVAAVAAVVRAAARHAADALAPSLDARVLRALPLAVPALAVLLGACVLLVWQLML